MYYIEETRAGTGKGDVACRHADMTSLRVNVSMKAIIMVLKIG